MNVPRDFSELAYGICETMTIRTILLVNTPSTGQFFNQMFLGREVARICYDPTHLEDLEKAVRNMNIEFDMICVDPYHEYKPSCDTFALLISVLGEHGILISHDCFPPNWKCASPTYQKGEWCGVTYAAFMEIASHHPDWFYGIITRDYGLGIISKTPFQYAQAIKNRERHQHFLDLIHAHQYVDAYRYFKAHVSTIIQVTDS